MSLSQASEQRSQAVWHILEVAWGWPVVVLLLFFALLPVYAPLMPSLEGAIRPVTSKIDFVDVKPYEDGLSLRMHYFKLQDCVYRSASADKDGVFVSFVPIAGGEPATYPTGERLSQPWKIGTTNLGDIRIRWVHECHPYWDTVTIGYP